MTPREKIAKLAIWAANQLAPDASTEEVYQHACTVWRDNVQEFHWQERNDLKSFFFFLFGEFHYEHQKAAVNDDTRAMREELTLDYPAYVDASGVMSVAEAQRMGIGEHERNCTCPLCAGDEPDEPQCPAPSAELAALESMIASLSYDQAHAMWDLANHAFWLGQIGQHHYERICALAKARMAELRVSRGEKS